MAPNLRAARRIRIVAEDITKHSSVLRASVAEQEVNIALLQLLEEPSDGVSIHCIRAALRVDAETLEIANRFEHERQERAIEQMQRDRLREKMNFIRSEVLRDPAAARAFWLVEHQGANYAESSALLDDLVHQASLWAPASRWVAVARVLLQFVERMPDIRRDRLVDQLAKIFIEYGQTDLAEELAPYNSDRSSKDNH